MRCSAAVAVRPHTAGKTLTVISLIATNRPGVQLPPTQMISLVAEDDAGAGAAAGGAGAAAAAPAAAGAAAEPAKKAKKGGKKGGAARGAGDGEDEAPAAKRRKVRQALAGVGPEWPGLWGMRGWGVE
jgi:SWI/SNF-related matrix-associated actin-dependent regulator of chromatin subfamily A3